MFKGKPHNSSKLACSLAAMVAAMVAHSPVQAAVSSWDISNQVFMVNGKPVQAGAKPEDQANQPTAVSSLIQTLVEKGILTSEGGSALLQQASADAARLRDVSGASGSPTGVVRVQHVPEIVRQQIRDELRTDIAKQAQLEGWVTKGQAAPEWTKRIRPFGDIRVRSQSSLYAGTNSNEVLDIARMNEAGPIDLAQLSSYQFLNTREDRWNRLMLRARIGMEAAVSSGVSAGFAIATGEDNSPISTNSTLGGGLAKRNVWLDLGYLKFQPAKWAILSLGRFENPFSASQMMFDDDLRFDGAVASLNSANFISGKTMMRLVAGVFPLDFGAPDYPAASIEKLNYPSKYLFSGELALKAEPFNGVKVNASVGYHSFQNVQGELSAPCNMDLVVDCSTDGLRPLNLRKGNTVFTMRNHQTNASGAYPQVFGLTFGYNILDANFATRVSVSDNLGIRLTGNYLKNLGFQRSDICRFGQVGEPFNNYGTDGNPERHVCSATNPTSFVGGDTGYLGSVTFGHDRVDKQGTWNVFAEYRYLESDAVLDSLADSDFHLGGTNSQGYIVGGSYSLRDGLNIGGRWLSANEISGEPLAIDVLQVDLKARF